MNRQMKLLVGGIVFFLILYLAISYSFFRDAVKGNEQHMVKQTRVSLREISDRMATFLNEQCQSMKVLPLFREIRDCIATKDFSFMHQTSLMSLTDMEIFVALDRNAECIMTEPTRNNPLLLHRKFAAEYVALFTEKHMPHLVSRPILIQNGSETQYYIFVFTPVYNPDRSVACIFGLGFNVEGLFRNYLKPLEANYDDSMLCITDEAGAIEVFNDSRMIRRNAGETILPPIPEQLKKNNYHGSYIWEEGNGKKSLIIYHPLAVDTRTLVAQFKIPYADIDRALTPFYLRLFLLFVILVLISLLGIFAVVTAGKQISQLKNKIDALEIQIDHEKKQAAVAEITGSDYFRNLQEQAERLKKIQ